MTVGADTREPRKCISSDAIRGYKAKGRIRAWGIRAVAILDGKVLSLK